MLRRGNEKISLHKKGDGYKKICKALHISQNTVEKRLQKMSIDGSATTLQRRPGRPPKLTPRQERLLMRRAEEYRHASSLQLAKAVESQTGVPVSHDTIRLTLQRNGVHGYHLRRKPLLKPMHKKARLELARVHSDETKIVACCKGEDFKEKSMVPTVKHGGVIMWGCMSAADVRGGKHAAE
uniref:Transposase Tc1-like domain-containing protein n=1 Tax=Oryzias latipes TaxID=8090 RepID=A0A3P9HIT4_ORYLA